MAKKKKETTHTFVVTITLSKGISKGKTFQQTASDKHLKEMAYKIADALRHECDSGNGIAPEDSEAFTEKIVVSNNFLPDAETTVDMYAPHSKITQ